MSRPDVSVNVWFAARAARSKDRSALTYDGVTLTYAALLDRIERLAGGLAALGVGAGDRVAFLGANQPALIETFLAANRLGAIFLPVNVRLAAPEIDFILDDAGATAIVADAAHRPVLDDVTATPDLRVCVEDTEAAGWTTFTELLRAAPAAPRAAGEDDTAILMYTSGTTGHPKGVILTNANLFWNNINLAHQFDVYADDVTLVVAPMFHIAALNVTVFTTMMKGGEVVVHRAFDAGAVLDEIAASRITSMFVVPAMLNAIVERPDFADADLSSLRLIICGGAPVPKALLARLADRGIAVQQGYGLTETAPSAIFLSAEHALTKIGSAGLPPLFVEVELRTDDGGVISEPGERGEVCLRGPNVSPGYWNRPDATAAAHDADGWFHTGDIGTRDADGFYYIVDRKKDMVITGGENVSPAEVENVIYTHPAVADVAVIGTPDEKWGEAVTAVVVVRPGMHLELADLREHCATGLARYKLPTKLVVVDELPRNAAGKVQKFRLTDALIDA